MCIFQNQIKIAMSLTLVMDVIKVCYCRLIPIKEIILNTFAATDVLTRRSLKLLTTPATFKHVLCMYDYIVISAFDVTLFVATIGLVQFTTIGLATIGTYKENFFLGDCLLPQK